jgi:hypothetical protein
VLASMVELTGLQLDAESILRNASVPDNTAESQRTKKRKVGSSVIDDWLNGAMASQEQQDCISCFNAIP